MALVTCARVGEALTQWLGFASQLKKAELCDALGCGPTDEEIAAVFMDCAGVAHIPGAAIPTCEQMDLAIQDAIDALRLLTSDSNTIAFTQTAPGPLGGVLSADVILDPDPANILSITPAGLHAEFLPEPIPNSMLRVNASGDLEWVPGICE